MRNLDLPTLKSKPDVVTLTWIQSLWLFVCFYS